MFTGRARASRSPRQMGNGSGSRTALKKGSGDCLVAATGGFASTSDLRFLVVLTHAEQDGFACRGRSRVPAATKVVVHRGWWSDFYQFAWQPRVAARDSLNEFACF